MTIRNGFYAAVLVALGFPPVGLWPLTFIGFIFFAVQLLDAEPGRSDESPVRAGFITLYAYSFFVNLLGFYWVSYTFHEFGGLPWVVAGLVGILGFALCSIPSGIVGALWGWIAQRRPDANHRALLLVPFLCLWDWIDFRLFPWTPAMSVGSDPLLLASVYFLKTWGWRVLFFAVCIYVAWSWRREGRARTRGFAWRGVAPVLGVLALAWVAGFIARRQLMSEHGERQPVALLQGNVGNYEKKLTKLGVVPTIINVMNIHQDLIEKVAIHYRDDAATGGKEVWVGWPETSFPGWPLTDFRADQQLRDWSRLVKGLHLVGGYEQGSIPFGDGEKEVDYNIVAFYHEKAGLVKHYRKRIRLAFGEYIPGDTYFPWLYDVLPAVNHFGKGDDFVPLPHPDPSGPVFIPLICYEILYDDFVKDFVETARERFPGRPLVIVNATNDSWYGPTSELFQHSLLARWAVVARGLPALRPTNTGLSQVIAPWGEVMATVKRDESLVVYGELPVPRAQLRLVK